MVVVVVVVVVVVMVVVVQWWLRWRIQGGLIETSVFRGA